MLTPQEGQLEELTKKKLLTNSEFYGKEMCHSKKVISENMKNPDCIFQGIIFHIVQGLGDQRLWDGHFKMFARNDSNKDNLYSTIDYTDPTKAYHTEYERPKLNFFGVQFFNINVRPHCYSIRAESPTTKVRVNSLASFCFQGYDEHAKKWNTLDEQRNITVLAQAGSFFAFPVTTNRYYRKFRLLQTDYSTARNMQFSLSGFDVHGAIIV